MNKKKYYFVNGITLYRILAFPLLVVLIFKRQTDLFKWLLAISFFTDMIDGWLARKYKVNSMLGATLDSIGDDLTIVAGIIGVIVLKQEFLKQHMGLFILLLSLVALQFLLALIRYGKISSFHTYMAKIAALMQGVFFILLFILREPVYVLFYIAVFITIVDIVEEIVLVILLPEWQIDVKGLYWILKSKQKKLSPEPDPDNRYH